MADITPVFKCPHCGSDNARIHKKPGYFIAFSFFVLGLPLPFFKIRYHCFDCGQDWKNQKNDAIKK
jgi:DNA-directed RNA polymerase subunit RPC12/RpoP